MVSRSLAQKSPPVALHLVAVVKMDVFADSEIQLGPLIDFNTEELERANADTRRMSTPKEKNEVRELNNEEDDATDPRVVLSAVHELLERLHQQSGRMEERFESLSDRVECMNTRVLSLEKENTQNVYYHPKKCRERELGTIPQGREKNNNKRTPDGSCGRTGRN